MRRHEVVVVVRRGSDLLVVERSPARGGYWNLIAGGVDAGAESADAAARELEEETGLRASVESPGLELSYEKPWGTVRLDAFVADAPRAWEPVLDEEHIAHRWCSPAQAVELLAYEEPRVAVRRVAEHA
ncbi:MAG TPA: NUDIX domain-containing protein [Gaiellaceae bacterium]|nr:NUDIX domain-containing protein [Gaiellaceae bacterium]